MNVATMLRLLICLLLHQLLLFSSIAIAQSEPVIKGKITEETGTGIPGVSVVVKGTTRGTSTDVNGTFSIAVPNTSSILVFSFTGYVTREITVGSQTTINLQLLPDGRSLEDVVVVGYGTQRKVDLTGAVSSITKKDFATKPFTSPDQILGGRAAGVHIANRSGDAGAPIDVRIRGVGTTGNNQPLWVIDGVPIVQTTNIVVNTGSYTESNPLAGINPSDIESIDVLKDASASAIYGARAANGVIIVTTKRGKEGNTSLTYDGYQGIQYVPEGRRFDVLNVDQYITLQKELGRDFSAFSSKPFVDWQDEIFRRGSVGSHNLTVTGGTKNFNFNVGGGYLGQAGVERAQSFRRLSLKVNSDLKVGKYLRFGESVLISQTRRQVQPEDGAFAAYNGSLNAPYYPVYDATTPFGYSYENDAVRGAGATGNNRAFHTDNRVSETVVRNRKMLGSIYGEFEPIAGLKYRLTAGLDQNVADGYFFQEAVDFSGTGGIRGSVLVQERPIELTTNLTNTLTYNKTFGKSDLTALIGYEETNFKYDKVRLQGRNLFNSNIRFASVAGNVAAANEGDHWALRGLLGRIFYAFDNKYLFTFNIRRDETSRFSSDKRSGVFPSFSIGWRMSEEKFMQQGGFFDDLKLRASWGESGNQYTGQNFAYLPSLATSIFYALGTGQTVVRGPAPIVFANSNLKWETSTQLNFGADIAILGRKLDITFDYYRKTTTDVLLSLPIPMTSGYFLPADANLGEIRNSGIELTANFRNSIGKLQYSIGGNITTVKNKVISLGGIPQVITGTGGGQTHRTTVGSPLGYFYGFRTNGIYQDAGEISAAKPDAFSSSRAPGDIRFVDVDGDGDVDSDDRTNMGSSIPDFYYGLNLSAGYKGFDLSLFLQGVGGVEIYNAARINLERMNNGNNQSTSVLNRWNGKGSTNSMPRAILSDPNNNNRYSDRWIENGSFMRIKNLQLGYTIPPSTVKKLTFDFISSSRFYLGVYNLATFTKYKGYDPEVTRGFSFQKGEFPLANGQDSGGSPQPTIVQLGWLVTFN